MEKDSRRIGRRTVKEHSSSSEPNGGGKRVNRRAS